MPSNATSLATLRPDLAESLLEYDLAADRAGFIASQVFPVIEVASQAGNFGKIPIEQLLQTRTTDRASGAGYARGTYTFDDAAYATKEHGAEEPVDDRSQAMYREYFDAELIATQRAYDAVLRNAEIRMAAKVFNASTWTGSSLTTAITNEWDDTATATPITDVEAAVRKIWNNSGLWANALVINRNVFRNLRNCEQVIERINSSGAGDRSMVRDITAQKLAEAFDLDYIIVGGLPKNTAAEGQTASLSSIWSDEYAMVCRIATGNDFREPCIGRTFHWAEDGSQIGGTVESYREEQTRSNIVRVRHEVSEVVLYTEAGHLLSNITT